MDGLDPNAAAGEDQEDMYLEESDASNWSEESWIQTFLSMDGNELFVEVADDFIRDDFNLTGLSSVIPYYRHALEILLDYDIQDISLTREQSYILDNSCEELYGMIHARYIITSRGLAAMLEKYQAGHFGICPRVLCHGQHMLPIGVSDTMRQETVKLFCPRCEDIYQPSRRHGRIDGAYFGTTFPHLFMLTYPDLLPSGDSSKYVPRIFGFKIHSSSKARLTAALNPPRTNPAITAALEEAIAVNRSQREHNPEESKTKE